MEVNTPSQLESLRSILDLITADELYRIGSSWGKPRKGHPEATIAEHIKELEDNLQEMAWRFSKEDAMKLRILIHVHDTLKIHAAPRVPIEHPHSHASLAADFLARFTDDEDLLNMVRYHDESFALYRQFEEKGKFDESRLDRLVTRIKDWRLFLSFNIIDNCTKGKERDPLKWFIAEVRKRMTTEVDEGWILNRS
jgi:hypothetical protein